MANTECLEQIIGITRQDCECISEELNGDGYTNDWYKISKSGFYLHELDGIVSIDTVKDVVSCEELPAFYQRIVATSITEVADDISASVNERYKKNNSDFIGFVGARTSSKALNITKNLAGLKVSPSEKIGGVLVIKGIGVMMNTSGTFDIIIYRRYAETNIFEQVDVIEGVNANANSYTENIFEDKILLPMQIDNEGELEYYFMYERNGMQPRNNLASCGCGRKEQQLKRLMNYGGVAGDVVEEMGYWSQSEYNNGLALDAEIRCNAEQIVCAMFNQSPEWAKYVAHAVIYKAAWKLHKGVLSSNHITQEIMANRETVNDNMNGFDQEYWTRIKYLVQNVDLSLNDCYSCDNSKLKVQNILL